MLGPLKGSCPCRSTCPCCHRLSPCGFQFCQLMGQQSPQNSPDKICSETWGHVHPRGATEAGEKPRCLGGVAVSLSLSFSPFVACPTFRATALPQLSCLQAFPPRPEARSPLSELCEDSGGGLFSPLLISRHPLCLSKVFPFL